MGASGKQSLRVSQSGHDVLATVKHLVKLGIDHFVGKSIVLVYRHRTDSARGVSPAIACDLTTQKLDWLLKK